MRGCCLHFSIDENQMKMCSFAFAFAYIKCFRTYSVYLSFRHGVFILYTPCHRCPLAVLRSCFGYSLSHLRTAAACLSRCFRHWRRSKAKPLRGSRGGCRRAPQNLPEGAKWVPQIPPRCSNSRTVRKACPPVLKACSPVLKAYLPMLKAQKIPCSK